MKHILALVVLLCLPCLYASAQTTAQIAGTVQDSSGASVAGAQVQITNVDTNAIRTTQTGEDGAYLFPSLAIGPYKLSVTKEGFVTFVQTGIVLQVNSNPEINVTLQVGAVSQTVEVQANAAMVETESNAGIGQVIQPEQVVDLPLNGREATQLIALSGGAVNTAGAGGLVNNLDYAGGTNLGAPVSFSVAGSQGTATNYYLDGSINMDFRTNVGLPLPFPDALQEFKVESSALAANSGSCTPGGSVNAATKSGTRNSFHGDAFDYLRNVDMDAYTEKIFITPLEYCPRRHRTTLSATSLAARLVDRSRRTRFSSFMASKGPRNACWEPRAPLTFQQPLPWLVISPFCFHLHAWAPASRCI